MLKLGLNNKKKYITKTIKNVKNKPGPHYKTYR